jgi:hypothetical protein
MQRRLSDVTCLTPALRLFSPVGLELRDSTDKPGC